MILVIFKVVVHKKRGKPTGTEYSQLGGGALRATRRRKILQF